MSTIVKLINLAIKKKVSIDELKKTIDYKNEEEIKNLVLLLNENILLKIIDIKKVKFKKDIFSFAIENQKFNLAKNIFEMIDNNDLEEKKSYLKVIYDDHQISLKKIKFINQLQTDKKLKNLDKKEEIFEILIIENLKKIIKEDKLDFFKFYQNKYPQIIEKSLNNFYSINNLFRDAFKNENFCIKTFVFSDGAEKIYSHLENKLQVNNNEYLIGLFHYLNAFWEKEFEKGEGNIKNITQKSQNFYKKIKKNLNTNQKLSHDQYILTIMLEYINRFDPSYFSESAAITLINYSNFLDHLLIDKNNNELQATNLLNYHEAKIFIKFFFKHCILKEKPALMSIIKTVDDYDIQKINKDRLKSYIKQLYYRRDVYNKIILEIEQEIVRGKDKLAIEKAVVDKNCKNQLKI